VTARAAPTSRVALVTGAARGIGAAIAKGLAADGVRVAALDVEARALEALPGEVVKVAADISEPDQCEAAVRRIAEACGALDVLINNAGLGMNMIRDDHFARPVRIGDIAPAQWRRIFDVNCMGAFLMTRAAVPAMVARGWGRIVNVTTSLFTMMNEGFAPYGPAKAALESASAIWAKELDGTGVTVNVLVPGGPTDTAMVPASSPFARRDLIPVAAMVPPARWLASPASDGVTGRRFVAALWPADAPPAEAAEIAGAPAAWPQLAGNVVWPGR